MTLSQALTIATASAFGGALLFVAALIPVKRRVEKLLGVLVLAAVFLAAYALGATLP